MSHSECERPYCADALLSTETFAHGVKKVKHITYLVEL